MNYKGQRITKDLFSDKSEKQQKNKINGKVNAKTNKQQKKNTLDKKNPNTKEEGFLWGTLGLTNGLCTLSYLQAEKLVWLLDTGVLKLTPDLAERIRIAHKLFWSLSAFIGLIRSLRALHLTRKMLRSPKRPKCAHVRVTQATLTSTKLLLDVVHVVSWLPRGWLWGGALTTTQASAVATASAVFGLVVHYHGKRLLPR
ncbi:unnamed protein product [Parnassius apollo]|uniref:(apollo) hypothetical protein n=1 Tax=Parnassius apollo TaxID=110799 RepID=A0A8S3W0P8_PARAO|nr:unnamed protein product [Parnassius apollo]